MHRSKHISNDANPWESNTSIQYDNIASIFQRAGLNITLPSEDASEFKESVKNNLDVQETMETYKLLQSISQTRKNILQIGELLERIKLNEETKDVSVVFGEKMKRFDELSDHLTCILANKNAIAHELHLPHRGDYIPLEDCHHVYADSVIKRLSEYLTKLRGHVKLISPIDLADVEHTLVELNEGCSSFTDLAISMENHCSEFRLKMHATQQQ